MSRSDLLLKLVEAGSQNDQTMLERTVQAMVAEARAKQHHTFADRLDRALRDKRQARLPRSIGGTTLPDKVRDLLVERPPLRELGSLALDTHCIKNINDLIQEQQNADLLRAHSLEPRNRVMLIGPPGNGKTSLAEAIAYELALPFYICRYEGVVGSYLGETAGRLKRVFDFARSTPCVLFFDEFDAIAKERGDQHETGEIKRVVSSLLMQVDDLPTYTIVVCATNHPELLDRAVWRRFQMRLELCPPNFMEIKNLLRQMAGTSDLDLDALAHNFEGASYSDIEEFVFDVRRSMILNSNRMSRNALIKDRLDVWRHQYANYPREIQSADASAKPIRGSRTARSRKKTDRKPGLPSASDDSSRAPEPEAWDPVGNRLL